MVAPAAPGLLHQSAVLSLLLTEGFKRLPFPLGYQDKQVLVLPVQIVQRPAEGGQFLPQSVRARFVGKLHILDAHRIEPPVQQRRDLSPPFFPQFRQGILYGSVIFQDVQRIRYPFCKV